jgi:hypothetical protein
MKRILLLMLFVGFAATFTKAKAVDYEKIGRTIVKEPKYTTSAQRYALLLFGPQAELKVWLVFDGDTVYLDRDMDGDLTDANERFDDPVKYEWLGNDVTIADSDGKTTYIVQSISDYKMDQPPHSYACVQVKIDGPVQYREYCSAGLWNDPKKTALAHFHGPLSAGPYMERWKITDDVRFVTGGEPFTFTARIGTSDASHQCSVVVCSDAGDEKQSAAFPGRFPTMDVEFPPKDPRGTPIKRRFVFDEYCCGSLFKTKVTVPPEVGVGKAKVRFAFDAWREGNVEPTTVELPVIASDEVKKPTSSK